MQHGKLPTADAGHEIGGCKQQVRHLCRVVLSSDCPVQVLVNGGCAGLVVVLAARAWGWGLPCLKAPADSCRHAIGCRGCREGRSCVCRSGICSADGCLSRASAARPRCIWHKAGLLWTALYVDWTQDEASPVPNLLHNFLLSCECSTHARQGNHLHTHVMLCKALVHTSERLQGTSLTRTKGRERGRHSHSDAKHNLQLQAAGS